MVAFFKTHPALPILVITVSLVYGSWHIFNAGFLAGKYYPVTGEGDTMFYGQRARAAYSGDWLAGDIALWENQKSPVFLPILNPIIMGALGKIMGSLEKGFVASDFIFPPLIFAALYFLAYELAQSRAGAALFASLFIFAPQIVTFPSVASVTLFTKLQALYFSRFEYPKLTFLFYALAFYFILRALKYKKGIDIFLAGASFGLLFYTYLYDWASMLTALFLMIFFFWLQKDYEKVKIIITIVLTGLAISVFYWINFLQLRNLDSFADIQKRIGMEVSRMPYIAVVWKTYLRVAALLAAMALFWLKKDKLIFIYITSFLLAYYATVNAQIIIGFNIHPDHWYRAAFLPWGLAFFVLGVWLYGKLTAPNSKPLAISAYVLISALGLWGLASNYLLARAISDGSGLPAEISESYSWLNQNTLSRSTVGSVSFSTENEIQLHAHNTVFIPNGANTIAPEEEIWTRTAWMAKIYGMDAKKFKNLLENSSMYLFHMRYRDDTPGSSFIHEYVLDPAKYEKEYKGKIEKYVDLAQNLDLKNLPFHLDYLYFGPKEKALGKDPNIFIRNLKKVYDKNQVVIYAL